MRRAGLPRKITLMRRTFRLRPTARRRLMWLVAFLLLWQQVAMAAYACTVAPAASATIAMHAEGRVMHDGCPSMDSMDHDSARQPLCRAHCHPDHAAQPDGRSGSVPPSVLAALPPPWPPLAQAFSTATTQAGSHRLRAPPPPPSLLFCSLLI